MGKCIKGAAAIIKIHLLIPINTIIIIIIIDGMIMPIAMYTSVVGEIGVAVEVGVIVTLEDIIGVPTIAEKVKSYNSYTY